jgi:hypothetical protein
LPGFRSTKTDVYSNNNLKTIDAVPFGQIHCWESQNQANFAVSNCLNLKFVVKIRNSVLQYWIQEYTKYLSSTRQPIEKIYTENARILFKALI